MDKFESWDPKAREDQDKIREGVERNIKEGKVSKEESFEDLNPVIEAKEILKDERPAEEIIKNVKNKIEELDNKIEGLNDKLEEYYNIYGSFENIPDEKLEEMMKLEYMMEELYEKIDKILKFLKTRNPNLN